MAIDPPTHRQGVPLVRDPRIKRGVGVKRRGAGFGLGRVQPRNLVGITIVRAKVEIDHELNLVGELLQDILAHQRIVDLDHRIEVEFRIEVVEDVVPGRHIFALFSEGGDAGGGGSGEQHGPELV